jgi:hypothetical protein
MYPTSNIAIALPSGTTVRVRNIVVFRGAHTSNLTPYVETPTPASDASAIDREASELASLHADYAANERIDRIQVGFCRTQACLEMRETPPDLAVFARTADGAWTRVPSGER